MAKFTDTTSTMTESVARHRGTDNDNASLALLLPVSVEDGTIVIAYKSILDRYWDDLMNNAVSVSMSDADYLIYKYNPRLYAADLLQNINLWALLLKMNGMISSIEFDTRSVLVPNNTFMNIINEIVILENEFVNDNRLMIRKAVEK